MKKILIFLLLLSNLSFAAQNLPVNSKELDKILDQAFENIDRGNTQKAVAILKKKISEDPSKIIYKAVLGLIYDRLGKKNEAEKEFNEAVKLQEKYPFIAGDGKKYDIRFMIGMFYGFTEDYTSALKWLNQVNEKEYNEMFKDEIWLKDFLLGIFNYNNDNLEEAKKYFLKSYIYDEDGSSENILGMIYLDEGNQKEAQKWLLASANKGSLGGQGNLGSLYYQLGDKKMALEWLQKALETAKKEKNSEQIKEIQETIKEVKNSQK